MKATPEEILASIARAYEIATKIDTIPWDRPIDVLLNLVDQAQGWTIVDGVMGLQGVDEALGNLQPQWVAAWKAVDAACERLYARRQKHRIDQTINAVVRDSVAVREAACKATENA